MTPKTDSLIEEYEPQRTTGGDGSSVPAGLCTLYFSTTFSFPSSSPSSSSSPSCSRQRAPRRLRSFSHQMTRLSEPGNMVRIRLMRLRTGSSSEGIRT